MTDIHWRNAIDGKFTKASNWSGKKVPGVDDTAILDAAGNPYTVISKTGPNTYLGGLQLASNATLKVDDYGYSATEIDNDGVIVVNTTAGGGLGFDTLVNTGTILVDAVLATTDPAGYADICNNSGLISISGTPGRTVEFTMIGFGTLTGSGRISLENGASLNSNNTIVNFDNTILGSGEIYVPVLINDSSGVIDASSSSLLTIDSGQFTITNAGTIETTSSGGAVINSRLVNTGELSASSGTLTLAQRVVGTGAVVIDGGAIDFLSHFNGPVTFAGAGSLELAASRTYTGSITGFASDGSTTLDLGGIRFVDPGEATFSGTASGGLLTVTDGTHTAHIKLVGDYLGATFVASNAGKQGVDVVAIGSQAPSIAKFASAMAGLTGHDTAARLVEACAANDVAHMILVAPRPALA